MSRPIRIDRPEGLEIAADPALHQVARLARGHLDRIVDARQADALAGQLVELVEMVHHEVTAAAVAVHDHGGRVVQGMRILRPALVDDRLGLGNIFPDALGQQQAAGMVLVLGIAVAGTAGEEDDLLLECRLSSGLSGLSSLKRTLRNCTFMGCPAWICKAMMPSLRATWCRHRPLRTSGGR